MYKYNVSTYDVLLWESELTPKPAEHLFTQKAQEGDLAFVSSENQEYIFKDNKWVKKEA